mmetsp:Transcript_30658/g.51885  ORF Transcript_30658/g.51885 Transcript_30658/m.51885 type:complete len:602 (+) Transcript_30658:47-1852(+)
MLSNSAGSRKAEEWLLYLCEMFTNLSVEKIQAQIEKVSAQSVGEARALEMLVNQCIVLSEEKVDEKAPDTSATTRSTASPVIISPNGPALKQREEQGEGEIFEMISLVPPSQETSTAITSEGGKGRADEEKCAKDDDYKENGGEDAKNEIRMEMNVDDDFKGDDDSKEKEDVRFGMEDAVGAAETDSTRDHLVESQLDAMVANVLHVNSLRGATAESAWKLLARLAENIAKSPTNPKFRRVPLSEKVSRKLSFLEGSLELCSSIGFNLISADQGKQYLFLPDDSLNLKVLKYAVDLFKAASVSQTASSSHSPPNGAERGNTPTTSGSSSSSSSGGTAVKPGEGIYSRSKKSVKVSKSLREKLRTQKRKAETEASFRKPRLTKSQMADLVQKRLSGTPPEHPPKGGGRIRKGKMTDFDKSRRLQNSIAQMRASKNRQWRNTKMGRKRVYTVSDLEKMAAERQKAVSNFGNKHELDKIGKEALKLTNEFRAKHGKPPLDWHQALCDIGRVHSKDMGDGKVPFSHTGFKERVQKYPFPHMAAAENLAMNGGIPESQVARVSVNGWIDSPGHRKNLLSEQTLCGIGVYRNHKGQYYLTQLFARTR